MIINGSKIKSLRESHKKTNGKHLSQFDLSCELDLTREQISYIETGISTNCTLSTICKIAEYFGTTIDELIIR